MMCPPPPSDPDEDLPEDFDPAMINELREEIPTLLAIKRFALSLDRVPWFANIGETLPSELREAAQGYLDGLGFPEVAITPIASWEEAADAAASLDWDSESWSREEQLRVSLIDEALQFMDETALQVALTHVASLAADSVRDTLENIAAIWDLEDTNLETAATGAAIQAAHNGALVLAAGSDGSHPFALKYQLFEEGRWPIGVAGTSFNLF
ncbi:MAG: hypothetical protein EP340_01835 [Alphaproteobacteria bacterium]|nr:MAG: hypothetical protein EP340_01835 [Alphaproteobacteria bacterium]